MLDIIEKCSVVEILKLQEKPSPKKPKINNMCWPMVPANVSRNISSRNEFNNKFLLYSDKLLNGHQ